MNASQIPPMQDLYYPISRYYAQKFGAKTHKIPVTLAEDCPNRMGLKGMQTCIFCDEWGSAARKETIQMDLAKQIEQVGEIIRTRHKASTFLVYFQAYTNTFLRLQRLRESFDLALNFEGVKGLVIGTRPDCLSAAVLELWQTYNQKTFVSVELGVQSFFDDQLEFLRRGHTREQSLRAIQKIASETSIDLGIHLMFGLPGETDAHIIETAELVSSLPVDHVKLHNLHVLKNTPLADLYAEGRFHPIDREAYAHRVGLFIAHLDPRIAIDRLAAVASRWEELIAPEWTRDRMRNYQFILDTMSNNRWSQGSERKTPQRSEVVTSL